MKFDNVKLNKILKLRGISLRKLEELTNVDRSALSKIISGLNSPQYITVAKICDALKLNMETFKLK